MAWGGGTYTDMNKTLPGTYIKINVSDNMQFAITDRGYLAVPMELPWGKEGEVIEVSAEEYQEKAKEIFGCNPGSEELRLVEEMLLNASTLYIYRIGTGEKATSSIGTAACGGEMGNKITVAVEADPEKGILEQDLKNTSATITAETNKITVQYTGVPEGYKITGTLYKGSAAYDKGKYTTSTDTDKITVTLKPQAESGDYTYIASVEKDGTTYPLTTATLNVVHVDPQVKTVKVTKGSEQEGDGDATEAPYTDFTATFSNTADSITVGYTGTSETGTASVKLQDSGQSDVSQGNGITIEAGANQTTYKFDKTATTGEYTAIVEVTKTEGQEKKVIKKCTFTVATEGEDIEESATVSSNGSKSEDYSQDTPAGFIVHTYFDGTEVDTQTVANGTELKDTSYVVFTPGVPLSETAGIVFSGGADGQATEEDHQKAREAFEAYSFNILALPSTDKDIQDAYIEYTKRLRNDYGIRFQLVVPAIEREVPINHESIIQLGTGVSDEGYNKEVDLIYWFAGLEAGCRVNKSCMNQPYTGRLTPSCKYTRSQLTDAIKNGVVLVHKAGDQYVVLKDINSLVTITAQEAANKEKNEDFKQNQTIRVIDGLANEFATIFNTYFLGQVPNDEIGRSDLRSRFLKVTEAYAQDRAIQPFNNDDLTISQGPTIRDVKGYCAFQPVNAMEYLYMAFNIIQG